MITPPRPTGSGPEANFFRWVYDTLLRLQSTDGENSKACRTTKGQYVRANARGGGGTVTPAGMYFRGEYDSSLTYHVGDVVVIRTGTNQGTFVCVVDNPGSANPPVKPDGGSYWATLAPVEIAGTWT